MKYLNVRIYIPSKSDHLSLVVTGFLMLQEKKKVSITYIQKDQLEEVFELPNSHTLLAFIEDKTIAFDMADGYNRHGFDYSSFLKKVDFYFKRSFSTVKNEERVKDTDLRAKMHPFGLYFYVTYRNNPLAHNTNRSWWDKYKQPMFSPRDFECKNHAINNPPIILFNARLWDPKVEKVFSKEELDHINGMRIEIIRKLRSLYPTFVGGIQDSEYAQELCPDLILNEKQANRRKWLELVKKADICIGSVGLHDSIGGKTAEYVAASKAIINERFRYEIPGDFEEGKNYLPFTTVDECLVHVKDLVDNPYKIEKMMRENQKYYERYGRPDRLIINALEYVSQNM